MCSLLVSWERQVPENAAPEEGAGAADGTGTGPGSHTKPDSQQCQTLRHLPTLHLSLQKTVNILSFSYLLSLKTLPHSCSSQMVPASQALCHTEPLFFEGLATDL